MRKVFLLLLLLTALSAGRLQAIPVPFKKPHKPTILKIDSSRITVRHFNTKALDSCSKLSAFDYSEHKRATPSWWTRFWRWVWGAWNSFWDWVGEILRKIFGGVKQGEGMASKAKYLLIVVLALALVYLVARLLGVDLLRLFRKKDQKVEVPYTESLENIHEINFNNDIEAAIAVKNYRLAVRLLYLRCLKQLSDAGAINWRIEKTNSAYLNELSNADLRQQFAIVTRQFEYVWYGNFPLDAASFQRINQLFQDFKKDVA